MAKTGGLIEKSSSYGEVGLEDGLPNQEVGRGSCRRMVDQLIIQLVIHVRS